MEVFLLLMALGMVSSFIGTLAGGGGIITLPAMMLIGIPIQYGIATNKFSSGIASFTSIIYILKNKIFTVKALLPVVIISVLGGIVGAIATTSVSEQTMNVTALVLLAFALFVTIRNKKWVAEVKEKSFNQKPGFFSKLIPFFIGIYDGGFGPGSATFSIIHYMREQFSYVQSAQLSRVLNFGSCVGAFVIFYQTGYINWHYAIALAIGSALGTQIGLLALPKIPLKVARTLLISIICMLIGQVVVKTF
ncbi:sulfite exporter TauE/SafE family protein [Bacillus mesophilus]|uniref:Probable membrane transporter protein n=2 Tax=Bacillus mesophilus TaxID=1808955 RepID=A0A6M0QA65_9BACI|nr:sulfite exporter TauE/SafE family protein [Bacillus mesophilus]